MNDITKLCDEMENCRKRSNCQFNEIVCVKKYLNEYIQDDYNNLLKLKTQADIYIENEKNELMLWNYFIFVCYFILSSFVAASNMAEKINLGKNMYILSVLNLDLLKFIAGLLLVISVAHFSYVHYKKKSAARKEWVRYIKAVLQDIEKNEFKNEFIT